MPRPQLTSDLSKFLPESSVTNLAMAAREIVDHPNI